MFVQFDEYFMLDFWYALCYNKGTKGKEMIKMKIYMAGAFFRPETKSRIDSYAADFRRLGYDVFVPQEHTVPNAWEMSQEDWAKEVFKMDIAAIQECDMVFVVYDGLYSDSGTAWEIGYAYALGKEIQIIVNNGVKDMSIMPFASAWAIGNYKNIKLV